MNILERGKTYFGPTTCKDATYNCRVKKQYVQIIHETNKLRELFNGIHLEDIKPPLTIVQIGNGCEGYSSNLFIPAKSELTNEDETLTRHIFFLEFNDEYQDLTKYSLIQQLNLPQLTLEELRDLSN